MRVPKDQARKVLEAYKKLILGEKKGSGLSEDFKTSVFSGKRKLMIDKALREMAARLLKNRTMTEFSGSKALGASSGMVSESGDWLTQLQKKNNSE